ncbi:MAG TPA: anthranilate phosphoribosyltransferase [Cyclobacteriaceae bacterium]|nr:anthranilate phosphoribosyltransferase [Cyclobacteriaceae bacterium]HMV09345.1 anthranilate phosphoribosyltransferase [Cyclobacteriaceae bacterium]HMV91657.1 anthranilate phosphoribosyltransferase [Cyclobacteriaceae bacterium]HMX01006.1 anthranilate phosphoribosyltransferase [Cyclobacteriaceae bacterium]HMX51146.1 anthranilate phosphoribosyltransferase [Cyclobacteriaceae bacterium]
MRTVLNELIDHQSLTKEEARQVLIELTSGKYNPSQTASFITVYMMRNITVDELQGFRDAMLELCIPARFDQPVMDVCGTGGDGKNTFNISTLSSFVVAAAGQPVAKHGNYGVSSACGSSNVLEYFGYTFTNNIDELKRSLDRANICFMHAPLFHPALKNVAPIRKELGVKTFFNMLGPMVNPAFPSRQLVGVFSLELARKYGYLYQQSDKQFVILHSLDGYDEISLTGAFKYFYNNGEQLADAADLGLQKLTYEEIGGGDSVAESAKIFMDVLEGRGTNAQNAAVIANAGMALYCADQKVGLLKAVAKAKESLESGKALASFKKLINR